MRVSYDASLHHSKLIGYDEQQSIVFGIVIASEVIDFLLFKY